MSSFDDWANLGFMAIFLALAIRIVRRSDDSRTRWLRLSLLVALSVVCIASLVGSGVE